MKIIRRTLLGIRAMLAFGIFAAAFGLADCSNLLKSSSNQATSAKGFPVTVSLSGGGSSSRSRAARDLLDGTVKSVVVLVYDENGNKAYSGSTPTLKKRSGYWGGTINVTETGADVFCAYAVNAAMIPIYEGEARYTVAPSGGSMTITTGQVRLQGGQIIGHPLSLSTVVNTIAGSTTFGSMDGTGTAASFHYPYGITTDGTNLFVADGINDKIRKIVIATGVVTTLAGSGTSGHANGTRTAASFNSPKGITTDGTNLYVADTNNNEIRKIVIATGTVTTLAGSTSSGYANGTGAAASFHLPSGITTDGTNLYVADWGNNEIRKIVIATTVVTTLAGAGSGHIGKADGTGTSASFNYPYGITTDGVNLYVAEEGNCEIRKVVIATAVVTTLAGAGGFGSKDGTGITASFHYPYGITSDGTNLYVADEGNQEIRMVAIDTAAVTTLAGSTAWGNADGTGIAASFSGPSGITTDGISLYVADTDNNEIRKIQ